MGVFGREVRLVTRGFRGVVWVTRGLGRGVGDEDEVARGSRCH